MADKDRTTITDASNFVSGDELFGHQSAGSRYFPYSVIRTGLRPYVASISLQNGSTATTFSGASTDFTNKVQVTVFDTDGISSGATPDHTNDHITIDTSATYLCFAVVSMIGGGNDTISFSFFKNNGATQVGVRSTNKTESNNGTTNIMVFAAVALTAADTLELWVQNETDTSSITIQDATMAVMSVT